MSKKLGLILAIGMLLAVFLASCSRSASTGTLPTPTATGKAAVSDPMQMLQSFATQTAVAATALASGGNPLGTPAATLAGTPNAIGALPTPTPTSLIPGTGVAGVTNTPVATAIPGVTVTPPARPATYTLKEGEFPYCIARRFNLDPEALLTLNGIPSGQTLFNAGLVLTIPQSGSFPGTRARIPHPATYTVKSGETIYDIACAYGDVNPDDIVRVNSLVTPYTLRAGQTLNIP
jgi:LysM repeat protein